MKMFNDTYDSIAQHQKYSTVAHICPIFRKRWWSLEWPDKATVMRGALTEWGCFCVSALWLRERRKEERIRYDLHSKFHPILLSSHPILHVNFEVLVRQVLFPLFSFQGSVCVQNEESLMLKAPKDSQNMKCAERGVAQSVHKFSFSQVTDSRS